MDPLIKQATDPIEREALNNILMMAGLSALAGGSLRGLVGLPYLFGTRPSSTAPSTLSPSTVNIPYPVVVKKKKPPVEEPAPEPVVKAAEGETAPNQLPWYYPLLMGASLPAFYGGYKGIDYLMDHYRKQQLRDDEEQARKEYEAALIGNYPAANVPQVERSALKTAAVADGAAALDDLADLAEGLPKQAEMPSMLGLYGALAALLGLSSGTLMYNYARDRSSSKLTEDAIRQRERQRWASRPPEVFAVPTPVKIVQEEEEDPLAAPKPVRPLR